MYGSGARLGRGATHCSGASRSGLAKDPPAEVAVFPACGMRRGLSPRRLAMMPLCPERAFAWRHPASARSCLPGRGVPSPPGCWRCEGREAPHQGRQTPPALLLPGPSCPDLCATHPLFPQLLTKRTKFIREIIKEVAGQAPYERRVMELLKVGKDKRALKLCKRKLGTHIRAKRKREEMANLLRKAKK